MSERRLCSRSALGLVNFPTIGWNKNHSNCSIGEAISSCAWNFWCRAILLTYWSTVLVGVPAVTAVLQKSVCHHSDSCSIFTHITDRIPHTPTSKPTSYHNTHVYRYIRTPVVIRELFALVIDPKVGLTGLQVPVIIRNFLFLVIDLKSKPKTNRKQLDRLTGPEESQSVWSLWPLRPTKLLKSRITFEIC